MGSFSKWYCTASMEQLPRLILGGAVFNPIYNDDPSKLPAEEIVDLAFASGINAIDTSPYYGRSEEFLGQALQQLKDKWPRESYFICTKAGRIGETEFDYDPAHVRALVERSAKRLHTLYLDVVYMHDIEFVSKEQALAALEELAKLKQEGLVRHIGVSGYPVQHLLAVAQEAARRLAIGALDAVLTYSNGCLQNTRAFAMADDFFACGVQRLMNGSIISMSLLRSGPTHEFHPAPKQLREAVDREAASLKEKGIELAELATRFALDKWLTDDRRSIVIGVSSVAELKSAIAQYESVQRHEKQAHYEALYAEFQNGLGPHMNETWPSGLAENN